ncbi:serine protease 7-like isoform X2 [Dermacentor variabilis]|uniref:serine protease 7-like isoform X2 n=1 Tax=Dermacentor variabilis TaxID=34621 RepID=UPI003F5C1009
MASLRSDYVPWYTQLYLTKVALVIFVMALPATANEMATNLNQAGCGELGSKGRIYHGKPTSKEDMPWIVQVFVLFDLSSDRGGGCGGSIITRNVILTAAHCLFVKGAFAQKVTVVYKSHLYNNGKAVQAEKMMLHPKYVSKLEIVHDIALLKLAADLEFNRQVKPVCLPTAKMDLAGKTLVVAGWGSTEWGFRRTVNAQERRWKNNASRSCFVWSELLTPPAGSVHERFQPHQMDSRSPQTPEKVEKAPVYPEEMEPRIGKMRLFHCNSIEKSAWNRRLIGQVC